MTQEVNIARIQRVLRQARRALRSPVDEQGLLNDEALMAEDSLILLIRDLEAGARVVA